MDLIITILPVVTKDLPISPLYVVYFTRTTYYCTYMLFCMIQHSIHLTYHTSRMTLLGVLIRPCMRVKNCLVCSKNSQKFSSTKKKGGIPPQDAEYQNYLILYHYYIYFWRPCPCAQGRVGSLYFACTFI